MDFTHFNDEGRAKMVNVGDKDITERKASAFGKIHDRGNEEGRCSHGRTGCRDNGSEENS